MILPPRRRTGGPWGVTPRFGSSVRSPRHLREFANIRLLGTRSPASGLIFDRVVAADLFGDRRDLHRKFVIVVAERAQQATNPALVVVDALPFRTPWCGFAEDCQRGAAQPSKCGQDPEGRRDQPEPDLVFPRPTRHRVARIPQLRSQIDRNPEIAVEFVTQTLRE